MAESHVQQARNELANGRLSGDKDAVLAARKRLAAAGVVPEDTAPVTAARAEAAVSRRAAAEREPDAAAKAPVGRQSPAARKSQT
jgi:hypothetical protein